MRASAGAATVALLLVFSLIAHVNAVTYPPGLSLDSEASREYMELLVDEGAFPEENAYYHPPGFYAAAGAAVHLGERAGLGEPLRAVQLANAVLAVLTALLVLQLAQVLWPGRTALHLAAVGFFTAGAVVLKAAAMFHPEMLSLFFSTLALVLAARMIATRDYRLRHAAALGLVLGAGQLVRAFSLWTFAVVVLTFGAVALAQAGVRRRALAALGVAVAAAAVLAGPWYVHQAAKYGDPVFSRPQQPLPLWERRPLSFYADPALPEVITRPYRPHFVNRFVPQLYADAWGDWFGVFRWNSFHGPPSEAERRDLTVQSVVGIVPTLLALAGWLGLLAGALRRPGDRPERLLAALLPLAGIAGMLYFAVAYPTPDGDVIKATYMLTTAPAWALCFGLALDRVLARRRRLGIVLAVLLAAGALVSLRFSLYSGLLG